MKLIVLICTFISLALGQDQIKKWISQLENPESHFRELKDKNEFEKYSSYDLAHLFIPKFDFLGYTGNNFQRLIIKITSVKKLSKRNDLYYVSGYSVLRNTKREFSGNIKITQIREYRTMHYGLDNEYIDRGFLAQGLVLGEFHFNENKEYKDSGVFKGIVTSYWYLDKNNIMQYDDLEADYSDGYVNNQYVGTWKSYKTTKTKISNWGEKRPPFSKKELDCGAAYFYPCKKYARYGWQSYIKQVNP